jgi:hypothetical protein
MFILFLYEQDGNEANGKNKKVVDTLKKGSGGERVPRGERERDQDHAQEHGQASRGESHGFRSGYACVLLWLTGLG